MRNLLPNFLNSIDQLILGCWRTSFIEIQFVFQMLPNIFYDIQIRTLCRPGEEIDTPLLTIICGDFGSMWGCIILLEDKWPIFITIDDRNALGEVFMQQRDIFFCIHFLVTHHQSSDAIRPNAPPKHDGEGILEGWLEKFRIFGLRRHSPNHLCSRIILRANRHSSEKNNIIPELSWPFSESPCQLKTICTVLYRNIRLPFPFKALKLVFVENFSHQRSAGTLVVVGPSYVRYNGLQCGKSQPPCNSTNFSFPPLIKFAWTPWSVLF